MSQITIVDEVLNFTEIATAPAERSDQKDDEDYRHENDRPETKLEKEQRIAHELTSILISGHLPK
ncbi:MAG TPA: hypothetical protein VGM52_16460 [Herbaspirillum sp.]|jgi:hypothetical protein